jgi:hypothetical protein
MFDFDYISFILGVVISIFACILVSDLVFPNDKWNWEDENEDGDLSRPNR